MQIRRTFLASAKFLKTDKFKVRVCEVEAGAGTRRRVMKNHLNDIILHALMERDNFGSARNRLKETIRKLDAQEVASSVLDFELVGNFRFAVEKDSCEKTAGRVDKF